MICHKCGKVVLWERMIVDQGEEKRVYHIQCWDSDEAKWLTQLMKLKLNLSDVQFVKETHPKVMLKNMEIYGSVHGVEIEFSR